MVSPFLRKVKTASGAMAVQIVFKSESVHRIVEHLASAHNETEVAALLETGRQRRSPPGRARGCWTWSPWTQRMDAPVW